MPSIRRPHNRRNIENVLDMKKPILHIRLDQRVDAVELKEQQLDETIPPKSVPNPTLSPETPQGRAAVPKWK